MRFISLCLLAGVTSATIPSSSTSSSIGTLSLNQSANATTVTIDHPPYNLVDAPLLSDLHDFLLSLRTTPAELSRNTKPKVVIFRSANPDFFLSHLDLSLLTPPVTDKKLVSIAQYLDITRLLQNITSTVFIAATNGRASGAGHELSVQMDMRFAGPRASSGSLENGLGLTPGAGGELFLSTLTNKGRALEYVLAAKAFDAPTGTRLGLWNNDFESEEALYQHVDNLAARIGLFSGASLNQTKNVLGRLNNPSLALLEEDVNAFNNLAATQIAQTLLTKALATEDGPNARAFELGLPEDVTQYLY